MSDNAWARQRLLEFEVARLAAENEKLRTALRPFADESLWCGPEHEFVTVKRSDCDTAIAALQDESDD